MVRHFRTTALMCFVSAASILAACSTAPGTGQNSKYGATVAKPYTAEDVAYGRKLQVKIDAARAASTDDKISKAAMEPFRIVGDLYFVGVHNFGVYVVKTPDGVIMLDSGWADTAEKTEASLKKIGVNLTDIKYILMTENHGDHNSAIAYYKEKTGAQVWVMEGDEAGIEKGNTSPNPGMNAKPAKVDRVIHDRDQLKFGGKVLTAYHIPGHTPGSTTWYWQESENGQTYNVADVCCWFTPNNVVSDPMYPTDLLRHNWEVLKSLPVDIPTPGIHTYHFDLLGKLDRIKAGEKPLDVWIDPQGYRGVIAAFEQDFEDKVKQQLKDGPPPPRALTPRTPPPGGAPGAPAAAPSTPPAK
jgi:metallo-beta-lactamase class B